MTFVKKTGNFVGKAFKKVTTFVTLPLHREGDERLIDTQPVRKNVFMRNLAKAESDLRKQSRRLRDRGRRFASGLAIRLPSGENLAKRGDNARENELCFAMAKQAVPFRLPIRFAGDEGRLFTALVRGAVYDKKLNHSGQNFNFSSVTGWELTNYVKNNKNNSKNAAYDFASYSEEELRLLSKDWLKVKPTIRSLAKFLSDYGSQNSPEHKGYLDLLGLNKTNASRWLEQVLEDRIFLGIHSFQSMPNDALRITYMVPIPVGGQSSGSVLAGKVTNFVRSKVLGKQDKSKVKTIAKDSTNFFQANLLCFKIVIEFAYDLNTKSFDKSEGTLITAFLHNLPFKDDDIKTLQNPCSNQYFSFSQLGMQQYINNIGTPGMPMLGSAPLFRLLNNALTPAAQKIESKYKSSYKRTHKQGVNPQTGLLRWVPLKKPHSVEFNTLTKDPSYVNKMTQEFTPLLRKLITRFNLYLNAVESEL